VDKRIKPVRSRGSRRAFLGEKLGAFRASVEGRLGFERRAGECAWVDVLLKALARKQEAWILASLRGVFFRGDQVSSLVGWPGPSCRNIDLW